MTDDTLLLDLEGPIATITFNKPGKANALDNAWMAPMQKFFEDVSKRPDVRCILIKANGKHFMAGGDLDLHDELIAMEPDARFGAIVLMTDEWNRMIDAMLSVPQPIIARVQGGVAGASMGLVAAADLVIAADTSFYFIAHVLHGGAIDGLTTYFLPRQIGYKRTMQLALLGQRVPAAQAESLGLINFVVPADRLEEEADKLVHQLANGPTAAYALIKELVLTSLSHSRDEHGRLEAINTAKSSLTEDWAEGSEAVHKKRPARFQGR